MQGIAGEHQSEWFANVTVTAGGDRAKVGVLLSSARRSAAGSVAAAHPRG